ncbi:hypothetical protein CPB86DRAFT_711602, partial [Serendipita vermifera]
IVDNNNPNPAVNLPGGIAWPFSGNSATDAALTTVIGLGLGQEAFSQHADAPQVFLGGVAYVAWYKARVLDKIEEAFAKGYDPALELAGHVNHPPSGSNEDGLAYTSLEHLRRKEQDFVDGIVSGKEVGHYYLLIGPKGSGKSTMILEAMKAIDAEGVVICQAHPDLEVFRLRLGKALNFEFNEDSQTGLFQRRDPREAGPSLDIERAVNKLEKVALRCHKKNGRPLVLIFSGVHLFPNNDEGRNMLLQIQQRAEAWSESGILTVVFTSDDLWPYMTLRKTHTRMSVLGISDLDSAGSIYALKNMRQKLPWKDQDTRERYQETAAIVGGRLWFLSKVSHTKDMVEAAQQLLADEKAWLRSQIGLIRGCDDDVMDEQKWSSCSWLLLEAFVKKRYEQEKEHEEERQAALLAGVQPSNSSESLPLPVIPYHECRQIMTRADFLEELDRLNIIFIDTRLGVRPDSTLILQAASEVMEEEGFNDLLRDVLRRIDEVESLERTRELTFKDLAKDDSIRLSVDKSGRNSNPPRPT